MNWEQWDNTKIASCELCTQTGGELIWQNDQLRVVLVDDKHFAGFTRVIWQEHVSEMTDLSPEHRSLLMKTVCLVETIQREVLKPHKVNLASLGNMTPHLHWHVIPRFEHDANFPNPVWALSAQDAKNAPPNGLTKDVLADYVRALKIALWS
jgi:diadenosine tetraphosphate (Ap4A) HIT family hydrolase